MKKYKYLYLSLFATIVGETPCQQTNTKIISQENSMAMAYTLKDRDHRRRVAYMESLGNFLEIVFWVAVSALCFFVLVFLLRSLKIEVVNSIDWDGSRGRRELKKWISERLKRDDLVLPADINRIILEYHPL